MKLANFKRHRTSTMSNIVVVRLFVVGEESSSLRLHTAARGAAAGHVVVIPMVISVCQMLGEERAVE